MRAAIAILPLCAACGGSDPVSIDAPSADAYDTARCLITGNYGDLGAKTGTAGTTGTGATTVTINLDPGPPGKDDYFVKLVSGKGVFAGGIVAGSYPIGGADAQFNNCGLCVNLIADIKPGTGPSKFYQATSGNVAFTSVTPPIAGAATNLHFDEIDITTGNTIVGGCTGSIAQITFSTP
jgi:hypothetical protein